MEWIPHVLAAAAALFVIWMLIRQRYVFVISLTNGQPRATKGKVLAAWLDQLADVCREFQIKGGWIGGVRQGKKVRLHFSSNLPADFCQRVRNLWNMM